MSLAALGSRSSSVPHAHSCHLTNKTFFTSSPTFLASSTRTQGRWREQERLVAVRSILHISRVSSLPRSLHRYSEQDGHTVCPRQQTSNHRRSLPRCSWMPLCYHACCYSVPSHQTLRSPPLHVHLLEDDVTSSRVSSHRLRPGRGNSLVKKVLDRLNKFQATT